MLLYVINDTKSTFIKYKQLFITTTAKTKVATNKKLDTKMQKSDA